LCCDGDVGGERAGVPEGLVGLGAQPSAFFGDSGWRPVADDCLSWLAKQGL
jgi:hypothetical protein